MSPPTDDEKAGEETESEGGTESETAGETAASTEAPATETVSEQTSTDGESPGPDEHYCSSCGAIIKKQAEICPECGVRQQSSSGGSGSKDRVTAGILALLLGGIGAHKFYLGETGLGILYLCFSWTLIPALIGFIEGILYLTKSDEEFQRAYVN